jgi:hypothetical protein
MKKLIYFLLTMASTKTMAQLQTQSVSIFKDGNAFYVKSGNIKPQEGLFRLEGDAIPKARNGTLWFASPEQNIVSIVAHTDTAKTKTDVKVRNITELLHANKGKKVLIETTNLKDNRFEGTIEEVEGDAVHFKTLEGRFMTFASGIIQRAEFFEKPSMVNKVTDNQTLINRLDVKFDSKKTEQPLELMYLQRGISWAPFYYLDLLSEKKARLTLRSEVVNDAEDLTNTTVNFVVGVPNFKFAGSLAGLVDFRQRVAQNDDVHYGAQVYQNAIPMMASAKMMDAGYASESFNNDIEGESVEDLYFYPLKNFSLKKGSRAHFQVFSEDVDYEHVYACDLVNQNDFSNNYQGQMNGQNPNKVFHSIKLFNKTKNPFTSAPVTIIQKTKGIAQPLAQDQLYFTPKQGESNVKITESPDVQVLQVENIKERDENGKSLFGVHYFKVTVEAKVTIKNFKTTPIQFELRRQLAGNFLKSDADWKMLQQRANAYSPNQDNQISWNVPLKAGEERTITYSYEVFGRN